MMSDDERLRVGRVLLCLRHVYSAKWEGPEKLVVASVGGRVEFFQGDEVRKVWSLLVKGAIDPDPVVGFNH